MLFLLMVSSCNGREGQGDEGDEGKGGKEGEEKWGGGEY